MFAASLENHESPYKTADVINDIVSGKRNTLCNAVGLYAEGFLSFRASMPDEDWVNSVTVDDDNPVTGLEQMSPGVRKYMQA